MLPDAQSLIRRSGAAAPLLDAVRDRKTRDTVRSVIDATSIAAPRSIAASRGAVTCYHSAVARIRRRKPGEGAWSRASLAHWSRSRSRR